MRKLIFSLFLLVFSSQLFAQTLRFEEFDGEKKIGEIVVTQSDSAENKIYMLRSHTDFKFLLTSIKAAITGKTIFGKDGLLLSSFYSGKRNGKPSINTIASRVGEKILVQSEKEKHLVSGIANFSTLHLYFIEPINVTLVFSERTGEFVDVKSLGNHRYAAPFSRLDGVYTYTNGKLTNIEATTPFGTLQVRLAK